MRAPFISRRAALLLPLAIAACAGDEPTERAYPPLRFGYLTPIQLNVARITVENRFVPGPDDRGALDPASPVDALQRMATDRLRAFGASGSAVFVIKDASLVQDGRAFSGTLAVELDVDGDTGVRAGYAEARVYRRIDPGDDGPRDAGAILYSLTKQLMDAMNVEFEFQVRRSLKDYITTGTAPAPAPVEQQALPPPGQEQQQPLQPLGQQAPFPPLEQLRPPQPTPVPMPLPSRPLAY